MLEKFGGQPSDGDDLPTDEPTDRDLTADRMEAQGLDEALRGVLDQEPRAGGTRHAEAGETGLRERMEARHGHEDVHHDPAPRREAPEVERDGRTEPHLRDARMDDDRMGRV